MSHKTRLRLAGIFVLLFGLICWGYPSYVVYRDYLELLNKADTVQLSVLTLWVPIGLLGALGCIFFMAPKAMLCGNKINEIYSQSAMQLANKICVYFALAGVAFAAGWTYHSIDLLQKYGYVYSRDLTNITPTGIHLKYVRATH
ncbi:hypothetical protein ND925_06635 [Vibrio diabolicus]|uniref:hypothetical protein n=1 Tax=Vibrio harveyi group TaxID=717610 RepID=UPI001BD34A27|nr:MULTISPECIES: hypothetical protein [Vibrio harveyi group]EGR1442682.1 hypothetical protein [Vibrio parahaemolyticus]EGR3502805.1 hypothetical protein [Vibrio parahaemolyticus]MBT0091670.1 hypothetical protein [Vibrio alginolyticus]MCS0382448.1 hypothetical protein [Vibrio diabolicus]